MNNQIFAETLPKKTANIASLFQQKKPSFLKQFYLSGGTGLSLQLGHRQSEDLDFFNQNQFQPEQILTELQQFGKVEQVELAKGTLNCFLNGVKLQFLEYPYELIEPTVNWSSIQLSSVEDVACTKLQTVSMRGSKKDFIDLYFIFKQFSLEELIAKLSQKYQQVEFSLTHILKSLIYFEDANAQPMPKMIQPVNWDEVKAKMIEEIKSVRI